MILQRVIWNCDEELPEELFFRGKTEFSSQGMVINANEKISFDTYVNMFSVRKWMKYSMIERISLRISVKGTCLVQIYTVNAQAPTVENRIASVRVSNETADVLENIAISNLLDYVYIRLVAEEETILEEAYFYSDLEAQGINERNLQLACCFCTYKREKQVEHNVAEVLDGVINNEKSLLYHKAEIFVSDNGQTLQEEGAFADSAVHLFLNKNYGGSAGFTRCMIEARFGQAESDRAHRFTHILLMDDDARIESFVIERTAVLLSVLKEEYRDAMIGGALFSEEEKLVQMENGVFMKDDNRVVFQGAYCNMADRSQLIANEDDRPVNYNGWFYTCIPAEFITKDNLPLPLFLHADDQDYGRRCKAGFIHMNGICIWHPNPMNVRKAYMTYYDSRNQMIMSADIRPDRTKAEFKRHLFKVCLLHVLNCRVLDLQYMKMAYEDFYKGIDWIKTLDAENKNRELMQGAAYDKCSLMPDELAEMRKPLAHPYKKPIRALNIAFGAILPGWRKRDVYPNNTSWKYVNCIGAKAICFVDPKTGEGISIAKSYGKMREARKLMKEILEDCDKYYDRVYGEWAKRMPEIKDYDFWKKYLEL